MNGKFKEFTLRELTEILAAFQSCSRNNKVSRALFAELELEIERKAVETENAR